MDYIGNPQDTFSVIHIAGTSGKTSTAYYVAAALQQKGFTVGLTVSPHIDQINERAQINGSGLPEAEYCQKLTQFLKLVQGSGEDLTYFELLVGFAYWLFAQKQVEYAVVEVGLGGLLDGTNVIHNKNKISVITDIGYDHQEILGDTLEQIAYQKAGIILPYSHVFIHRQPSKIMTAVKDTAGDMSATLHTIDDRSEDYLIYPIPTFQARNLAMAIAVVEYATSKLSKYEINAISQTYIPARMEVVAYKGRTVILDGSHNQQKLVALKSALYDRFNSQKISLLVSIGNNKGANLENTLHELRAIGERIILTEFSLGQDEMRMAIPVSILAAKCLAAGFTDVRSIPDPVGGFNELLKDDSERILVTGSYFLLNHIRPLVLS